MIQISYFLPSLTQTSHPSRLSPFLTSPHQAPSFLLLFAVENRLMKFIQNKMGDSMPSSSPSSSPSSLPFSCCLFLHLCLFYLPFSVLLYLAVYCPFHLSFTLSSICLLFFLSMGLLFFHLFLLISTVVFVCVYPSFLFPRHPLLPLSLLSSVFLHFHSCILHLEVCWLHFSLFRQKCVCACVRVHLVHKSLH